MLEIQEPLFEELVAYIGDRARRSDTEGGLYDDGSAVRAEPAGQLKEALPEMGRHLSEMERRASDAERELIEWKKVRFMADKVGDSFKGYVTGVQAFGLFVELDEVYVQGLVHVSSMTDDYYLFDQKAHLLKGEHATKVYRPQWLSRLDGKLCEKTSTGAEDAFWQSPAAGQ